MGLFIEIQYRSTVCKAKKALRAVIPGFINYKYKDGKIPGHTKSYFFEYKILSMQNIIAFNTLILMHKIHNYPSLLPESIVETIPLDSPVVGSNYESCEHWLKLYNSFPYNNSIFFKGPLLLSGTEIIENLPSTSFKSIKLFKTNVKQALLSSQSSGNTCEWQNSNFLLYNVTGLRKSNVSYRAAINYSEN